MLALLWVKRMIRRGGLGAALWLAWGAAAAPMVSAQSQPSVVTTVDLGVFGLNTLATISPSLYFRPFELDSARPSAVALGMGGAHLALASGAPAIGWTPAGLVDVPSLSVALDGYINTCSGTTSGFPDRLEIPTQPPLFITHYSSTLKSDLRYNLISVAAPLWTGTNQKLAGSFGWRRDQNTSFPEETVQDLVVQEQGNFPVVITDDRQEKGAIEAVGPSLALQILPAFSVGANFNYLTGRLRTNSEVRVNTGGAGNPVPGEERFTLRYKGFSYDLGARLNLGDRVRLAGKITPSHTVEVTGGAYSTIGLQIPGFPATRVIGKLAGYDLEVPAALGVGVALKPIDRLWLAADFNSRKNSDAKLTYNGPKPPTEPDPVFDLLYPDQRIGHEPVLPLADASSVHLGLEYRLLRTSWAEFPVRLGYRKSSLGFRDLDGKDYRYIYSYDLDPSIDEIQTLGVFYTGIPTGKEVKGDAYSFGTSLDMGNLRYDVGIDVFTYQLHKFYAGTPWDPVLNPSPVEGNSRPRDELGNLLPATVLHPSVIQADRTVTTFRFSATYSF